MTKMFKHLQAPTVQAAKQQLQPWWCLEYDPGDSCLRHLAPKNGLPHLPTYDLPSYQSFFLPFANASVKSMSKGKTEIQTGGGGGPVGSMTDAHKLREMHCRAHTSSWYPQVRALQYIAGTI